MCMMRPHRFAEEADDVRDVLAELGVDEDAQEARLLSVLNKSDLLDGGRQAATGKSGTGRGECTGAYRRRGGWSAGRIEARIGAGALAEVIAWSADGAARAWLFSCGDVRRSKHRIPAMAHKHVARMMRRLGALSRALARLASRRVRRFRNSIWRPMRLSW